MTRALIASLGSALLLAGAAGSADDHSQHDHSQHGTPQQDHSKHQQQMQQARLEPSGPNVVDLDVPDVELVDQDGETARFVSQRIGDDLAVITFTFTTCTTICPALDGIFKRLQNEIGDELGQGTVMLTVSVDPENDIPERLKQHAVRLRAKPGWSFLTGERETVTDLLKAVEVFAPDILDHAPSVFVVDGRRGVWTRLYGFPKPAKIEEVLDGYRAARAET